MSFFDKMFDKKICSICGAPIDYFKNNKLLNGNCCQKCASELSPWFNNLNNSTVENIRYQIYWRRENNKKLQLFYPTISLGTDFKVLIDEIKSQFTIARNGNYIQDKSDIISCANITSCNIDIKENKKEVKYKDSNGEKHSFVPPFYAYSYDFFVSIDVNIPYIKTMKFKLNKNRINNGQNLIVDMPQTGIFNKFKDKMFSDRSFNGKTSNIDEVTSSVEYKKYEGLANEIKEKLYYQKQKIYNQLALENSKIRCPWCNSKVINTETHCPYCDGPIDIK